MRTSSRLNVAIFLSLILHAAVLFSINFQFPSSKNERSAFPLEVVLVNSKVISRPDQVDPLARANLDRGRNIDRSRAKTPYPLSSEPKHRADEESAMQKPEQLEPEAQPLMAALNSDERPYPSDPFAAQPEQNHNILDATDLVQRGLEIARVEAQASYDYGTHKKPPKRKFIGTRTQDYRFARYVEDWRLKVERIGNLNYPEAAKREKLYGNLQITVGIKSDGSLESIEINRPSSKKVLDEAAVRIVKLAGQNGFAPFPPDISADVDVLHITRTWVFTRSDELASE
ncbi:MAG TPA: TonB family protein [Nitrosospira sp.]|nr:TonB family protein [Nitrosospira sp.]